MFDGNLDFVFFILKKVIVPVIETLLYNLSTRTEIRNSFRYKKKKLKLENGK